MLFRSFEVRAPNPHTNSYLAIAAIYMGMLDGVEQVLASGRSAKELEAEISKPAGAPGVYLPAERAFRSEHDVFEHFTQAERDAQFGAPPATVAETLTKLASYPGGEALLCAGGVFTPSIIASYRATMLGRWRLELSQRIIPAYMELVRQCSRLHDDGDAQDDEAWAGIQALRVGLMKNLKGEPEIGRAHV